MSQIRHRPGTGAAGQLHDQTLLSGRQQPQPVLEVRGEPVQQRIDCRGERVEAGGIDALGQQMPRPWCAADDPVNRGDPVTPGRGVQERDELGVAAPLGGLPQQGRGVLDAEIRQRLDHEGPVPRVLPRRDAGEQRRGGRDDQHRGRGLHPRAQAALPGGAERVEDPVEVLDRQQDRAARGRVDQRGLDHRPGPGPGAAPWPPRPGRGRSRGPSPRAGRCRSRSPASPRRRPRAAPAQRSPCPTVPGRGRRCKVCVLPEPRGPTSSVCGRDPSRAADVMRAVRVASRSVRPTVSASSSSADTADGVNSAGMLTGASLSMRATPGERRTGR